MNEDDREMERIKNMTADGTRSKATAGAASEGIKLRIAFRKSAWVALLVSAFPAYVIVGAIAGVWNGWRVWGVDLHEASKT
jgi:hypothetical protein